MSWKPAIKIIIINVNGYLISDHYDLNRDIDLVEGAESENSTSQSSNKILNKENWEPDCYFIITIGHCYDHGSGITFKCPLSNILYVLVAKMKNIHYMLRQHLIDPINYSIFVMSNI